MDLSDTPTTCRFDCRAAQRRRATAHHTQSPGQATRQIPRKRAPPTLVAASALGMQPESGNIRLEQSVGRALLRALSRVLQRGRR
jgi:hypothetical protein